MSCLYQYPFLGLSTLQQALEILALFACLKHSWKDIQELVCNITSRLTFLGENYERTTGLFNINFPSLSYMVLFFSIKTAFGYVPSTRPDPLPMLKQLAYQQFLPLPGPLSDPEGWKTLRPVLLRGVTFRSRQADARCTVSSFRLLSRFTDSRQSSFSSCRSLNQ